MYNQSLEGSMGGRNVDKCRLECPVSIQVAVLRWVWGVTERQWIAFCGPVYRLLQVTLPNTSFPFALTPGLGTSFCSHVLVKESVRDAPLFAKRRGCGALGRQKGEVFRKLLG